MVNDGRVMRVQVAILWLAFAPASVLIATEPPDTAWSVDQVNQMFLADLDVRLADEPLRRERILAGWNAHYRDEAPAAFVVDALCTTDPDFKAALEAYDAGRTTSAIEQFASLRRAADPFVAANALYFYVRSLADARRYETLAAVLGEAAVSRDALERCTVYAPHLGLLQAAAQARNLQFDAATMRLDELEARYESPPEPVRVGVDQLRLEVDRREIGTLGEVAGVMDYVSDRLDVVDTDPRVHERQEQILAMLDELIEEQEQNESSGGGSKSCAGQQQGEKPGQAQERQPLDESKPHAGAQQGEQHEAPREDPGEVWGKLPPAERERILQAIRERYPSRYRQIVEQYYRALAEQ